MILINLATLNIKAIPDYSYITDNTFHEIIYDTKIIKNLLESNIITDNHKKLLLRIYNKMDNGVLNVKYNNLLGNIGRFYPESNISLLYLPRMIKHTIFKSEKWIDIDIVKSYPTIIYEIGRINGHNFHTIYEYINNFEDICNMFRDFYSDKLTNSSIKNLFNNSIFGGNFITWVHHIENNTNDKNGRKDINILKGLDCCYNEEYSDYDHYMFVNYKYTDKNIKLKTHKVNPFYEQYLKEFKIFFNIILVNNTELINLVIKDLKNKSIVYNQKKINYLTLHHFFGTIESYIISISYNFLLEQQIIVPGNVILEFDGICIPNFPHFKDKNIINQILKELNEKIYRLTNMNFKFIYKAYEDTLKINF